MSDIEQGGVSRRDLMKRGAIVGGTLVWATPVVQSLTTPAFAGTPAEPGCPEGTHEFVRLKFEVNDNGTITVSNDRLGDGQNQCDWPEFQAAPGGDIDHVVSTELTDDGLCMKIKFDDACDAKLATAMVKSGSKTGFCIEEPNTGVINDNTLKVCISRQQISYVAVLVCCRIH
jgi:hypothetical protein